MDSRAEDGWNFSLRPYKIPATSSIRSALSFGFSSLVHSPFRDWSVVRGLAGYFSPTASAQSLTVVVAVSTAIPFSHKQAFIVNLVQLVHSFRSVTRTVKTRGITEPTLNSVKV